MILKHLLKLTLLVLLAIQTGTLYGQSFTDYKQLVNNENITIDMVAVKGGSFLMGASNSTTRKDDEKPSHEVEIDNFWMGKYEITWAQYDAFVYNRFETAKLIEAAKLIELGIDGVTGATPPYVEMSFGMGKGDSPAINMTQYAALMYCKWLTSVTGVFYRLPTEAEWEYACKKGKTDYINNLKEVAWFTENAQEKYEITGTKKENSLGIHDMLGNVSEWVLDQYSTNYYADSPKKNPWNIPTKLYPRVLRGGSWKDTSDKLCCTSRDASNAKLKSRDPQIPKSNWWHTNASNIGFRIVRPKIQPSKQEIKKYWLEAIIDYGLN